MKRSLNLIPIATQRKHAARRAVRICLSAIAMSSLACAVLLGIEWARGMAALQELQMLEAQYAPLSEIAKDQRSLVTQIAQLRGREQLSLRLSHHAHGVTLLGAVAQAVGESPESVYIERFEYDEEKPGVRSLNLAGSGVDGVSVAAFAARLRESEVFESVAIASSRPLVGGLPTLRRFEIECVY